MKTKSIRSFSQGGTSNVCNGANAVIKEYNKEEFVKTCIEYLSSEDKHCYIQKGKGQNAKNYCSTIISFDIEVSSIKLKNGNKVSVPYIWQIAIQDYVFYGRKFDDIEEMFNTLSYIFEANENNLVIVWVHNLAYEFAFIKKYFKWLDVFSLTVNKPIRATTSTGLQFRCSYALSGMALKDIDTKIVTKMVGDLDYYAIRHENTPLTDKEMKYAINDVLVVVEYLTNQINGLYEGDITKLPMTKTGAVRRYVRDIVKPIGAKNAYTDLMEDLTVGYDEYITLHQAFAGGFTHANANYVGKKLTNVASADISSSYPAVLCTEKFPMSKGRKVYIKREDGEYDWDLFETLNSEGLTVFRIKMFNVESKFNFEHILQYAKCYARKKTVVDNNRIVSAEELCTVMTSVDFEQFLKFYYVEYIEVEYVYYYEADYLPRDLLLSILQLYSDKTILKGIKGKELEYNLKKSNLNSVYGMMVMNIVKPDVIFNDETDEYEFAQLDVKNATEAESRAIYDILTTTYSYRPRKDETEEELINRLGSEVYEIIKKVDSYNSDKSRFLFYPWGVFVTSYARQRLQNFILMTRNDHVYSDTDSDKFLHVENHLIDIDNFNKDIDNKVVKVCNALNIPKVLFYPKDKDGNVHPLGYLDYETKHYKDGTYQMFKTLGAKRYLYSASRKNKKGEWEDVLELTCAGVNKESGAKFIKYKYIKDKVSSKKEGRPIWKCDDVLRENPFDFFDFNMNVPAQLSGKLASQLHGEWEGNVTDYLGNTCWCKVKSGIYMEPAPFRLKIEESFSRYLKNAEARVAMLSEI